MRVRESCFVISNYGAARVAFHEELERPLPGDFQSTLSFLNTIFLFAQNLGLLLERNFSNLRS